LSPQANDTIVPTAEPSISSSPSSAPSVLEMETPSFVPSRSPSATPTINLTLTPTQSPPANSTAAPSQSNVTSAPTQSPTTNSSEGTSQPSSMPSVNSTTSCEDLPRATALIEALVVVTDAEILINSETPQGKAGFWLLNADPASVDPCTYPTLLQRYALATLYFATEGDNWIDNAEWLLGEHECNWTKVSCDETLETTDLMLGTSILDAHHFSAP
jgi:hypothetical protein